MDEAFYTLNVFSSFFVFYFHYKVKLLLFLPQILSKSISIVDDFYEINQKLIQ